MFLMRDFNKKIVIVASVFGAITIAIGAFGAHVLKEFISEKALTSFETGVQYQMYHVLAILILGFTDVIPSNTQKLVFRFFIFGIILFSVSIYFLSLNEILPFNSDVLGFITPIGGMFFIIGWLQLGYGLHKSKSQ